MRAQESTALESVNNGPDSGVILEGYLIPYPPGVPLAVPGDRLTRRLRDEVGRLRRAGVEVFLITV
jgi:arginine/lysine/ornithine decarboxylase